MNWTAMAKGINCPFDMPRVEPNPYWESVGSLRVSTLCLLKNQAYRGHCILIFDPRHAVRLDELSAGEWAEYAKDLQQAVRAIMGACRPDHINVEAIGNRVPHLHWQLIPRYREDPRWGGPIWTTTIEELAHTQLPDAEQAELISSIRARLEGRRP